MFPRVRPHMGSLFAALLTHVSVSAAAAVDVPSAATGEALRIIKARADNAGARFIVVDKKAASLWVFDDQARLLGTAPVLLGAAVGDDSLAVGVDLLIRLWCRARACAPRSTRAEGDQLRSARSSRVLDVLLLRVPLLRSLIRLAFEASRFVRSPMFGLTKRLSRRVAELTVASAFELVVESRIVVPLR